ncbi:M16 family metallopeptidase [Pseudomonas fulva]|uniref:M16 family metallopeptidase n=1 Tax=Pseudomonas fulva TaxID=47880 RepID=UPI002447182A|nr:pitrilysin family protein [Pseudomonas fulva]MDH0617622.1 insulinase family protein [Pseudomonas fulva]
MTVSLSAPSLADDVSAALASLAGASPSPVQHFTLENGLSVYLRQQSRNALAAVQLWYNVGTRHEPAGQTNLSHLLEHVIFEGSRKLEPGQYAKVVARLAGQANASTLLDATSFDMLLPASRLPVALELLADAMDTATFGLPELARGAKAIADERRLKVDAQPIQQAYDRHLALAHGSSPYATPSFGSAIDLQNIDLPTLRQWYTTRYRPNNATLVVVGNVELETLKQQVETYFAHLERGQLPDSPFPRSDAPMAERSQAVSLPGLSHGLLMSFNVPSCATANDALTSKTLELICEVLAEGSSAWLYAELVRGRGLLTGVAATYDPLVRGDTVITFSAYVNTLNATLEQATEATYEQIARLQTEALSAEQLQQIKLRLLARQLFSLDSATAQASQIGAMAATGQPASLIDEHARLISIIDSAQVQQVARTYLGHERLTTTSLLPGAQA